MNAPEDVINLIKSISINDKSCNNFILNLKECLSSKNISFFFSGESLRQLHYFGKFTPWQYSFSICIEFNSAEIAFDSVKYFQNTYGWLVIGDWDSGFFQIIATNKHYNFPENFQIFIDVYILERSVTTNGLVLQYLHDAYRTWFPHLIFKASDIYPLKSNQYGFFPNKTSSLLNIFFESPANFKIDDSLDIFRLDFQKKDSILNSINILNVPNIKVDTLIKILGNEA